MEPTEGGTPNRANTLSSAFSNTHLECMLMISLDSAKPLLSALLPIGRLFDRVYSDAIVPCSAELGLEAQRVESEFSDRAALLKVHQQIRQARVVIADLTAKNPNILYGIGYAHAAEKRVILIAQHGEDLPFPRTDYPTLIYGGNTSELLKQLRENLPQAAASVPVGNSANGLGTAPVAARERFFSLFGELLAEHGCTHGGGIRMENEKTFVLENQEMDLALVQALARRARELGIRLKLL